MLHRQFQQWRKNLFLGWWVLFAVMVLQMLVAGLFFQSFGVYVPVLIKEFGWSATAISLSVSARQLFGSITGPAIGFAIDRYGSKAVIGTGLVLMGIAYISFSRVNSLTIFILVQLFLGFAANLSGWLPCTKLLVNWFARRRTRALAFMSIGMSVGGLLSPLIAYCIGSFGWRSVAVVSGLAVLSGLSLLPLLRNSPEAYGLEPEGYVKPSSNLADDDQEFTAREAMRTRSFWLIAMGHGLALMSVVTIITHYVTHVSTGLGYSLQTAASLFAVLTTSQIIGQLISGFFGDILSKRWLAATGMLLHSTAFLGLALAKVLPLILIASMIHGIAWGLRGPLMSALRADYFGRKDFGKIMGISDPIIIVGALVGPVLAGYSFDHFGSYSPGFLFISAMALIGGIFFAMATKPQKRAKAQLSSQNLPV